MKYIVMCGYLTGDSYEPLDLVEYSGEMYDDKESAEIELEKAKNNPDPNISYCYIKEYEC